MKIGPLFALLSAFLFGISTPFAKMLTSQAAPQMLAGLLYAGSGLGLLAWYILRIRLIAGTEVAGTLEPNKGR
jgi:uncharacterized membrane protein